MYVNVPGVDMEMVNKHVGLTYFYLLIYIALSSGVILYNKVIDQDLYTIIPFILTMIPKDSRMNWSVHVLVARSGFYL